MGHFERDVIKILVKFLISFASEDAWICYGVEVVVYVCLFIGCDQWINLGGVIVDQNNSSSF